MLKMKKFFLIFFLIAFTGLGTSYSQNEISNSSENQFKNSFSKKKPKNIILMIGDGMGLAQSYAAYTAKNGSLILYEFPITGFSKTSSSNNYITDSAAGGTAIACGVKTNNGAIGVDKNGTPVKSILEYAEEKGLATGLIATYEVTNATPASFIAHQPSRTMEKEIAIDYLKTDVDVIIGGGRGYFQPHLETLTNNGYQVKLDLSEMQKVKNGKLAAFLAEKHMPTMEQKRGDMLPESVKTALNILSNNSKGFFVMVEGSQIDGQCHANNLEGEIAEAIDFDNAVKVALDFAKKDGNTLVIVTADHETGGLTLTGGSYESSEVKASFSTVGHTSVMVPVFAFGPGAKNFTGVYENIAIFSKMKSLLKL